MAEIWCAAPSSQSLCSWTDCLRPVPRCCLPVSLFVGICTAPSHVIDLGVLEVDLVFCICRGGLNLGGWGEECATAGVCDDVAMPLLVPPKVGLIACSSSSTPGPWIDAASDVSRDFCLLVGLVFLNVPVESGPSKFLLSPANCTGSSIGKIVLPLVPNVGIDPFPASDIKVHIKGFHLVIQSCTYQYCTTWTKIISTLHLYSTEPRTNSVTKQ